MIIVDGDHSEQGVEADIWWVQDLPDGIVVMDDDGDPSGRASSAPSSTTSTTEPI